MCICLFVCLFDKSVWRERTPDRDTALRDEATPQQKQAAAKAVPTFNTSANTQRFEVGLFEYIIRCNHFLTH